MENKEFTNISPDSSSVSNDIQKDPLGNHQGDINHNHRRNFSVIVFFGVFLGIAFGFLGGVLAITTFPKWQSKLRVADSNHLFSTLDKGKNNGAIFDNASEDSSVIDVVKQGSPAVVSIVISRDIERVNTPFFFDPFGGSQNSGSTRQRQTIGQGSGFFVASDGMIVTNKHVVSDDRADYTVVTNDGKEYPAKVIAKDPNKDIAIMKVEGNDFPFLEMGNSDDIQVGQTVVAIGNSLGEFSNTVSKGIVSGLRRSLVAGSETGDSERLSDIIQTDAAINPGNSGGPLLNVYGKVIGVNVAMAQGAENIGFAVPVSQVKKIVNQVQSTGKIATPFLGVRYIILDDGIQKGNNLPFNYGALVLRGDKLTDFAVIPGSPADKAGIMENDIILEVNGKKIDKDHQISDIITDGNVGDAITMKVWHKGETKDVTVTLEERK